MITQEDIKRLNLPKLTPDQIRRISNAENVTCCKNAKELIGQKTIGIIYLLNYVEKIDDCEDYFRVKGYTLMNIFYVDKRSC